MKIGITAWDCKGGVRIDKAQLKLNSVRNVRNNKKGFYKYISQKKKDKRNFMYHQVRQGNWWQVTWRR